MDYLREQIAQTQATLQSVVPTDMGQASSDFDYWLVVVLFCAVWLHLGYNLFLHPKH